MFRRSDDRALDAIAPRFGPSDLPQVEAAPAPEDTVDTEADASHAGGSTAN